ncbi:MAG: Nramp family divalent metal transporter [Acidobacteriaceae bacterium]
MATAATAHAANPPATSQRKLWYYFGPAFVASIAYIDPGNFAANFEGGTRFGYQLLWVLLLSNAMAILIQYLSAKLGIATGHTLPENCRLHFSRGMTIFLWVAAEISALATDLAEFLGAALGFYLLFGPRLLAAGMTRTHVLLLAAVATAICVFFILMLQQWGFRQLELVIMLFVVVIGGCYAAEMFFIHPHWGSIAYHTVVPILDRKSLYLAVAMLGATVMPHVVYLHSGLVQPRVRAERTEGDQSTFSMRQRLLRMELFDLILAMNGAWLVNSAMIVVAAAAFAGKGMSSMSIEAAHATLGPLVGPASAALFAVALLCSGLSSSTVGTMAGQMILEGFMQVRFSIFLRRLLTLLPALVVIGIGLDPLRILLLSQAALSFTLPFALIPLLILTQRAKVMNRFANGRVVQSLGWISTAIILSLNGVLLWQALGGS